MWDERYSIDSYVYGESPNDFLRERVSALKRGRALCLAEGEGRNSVFLAKHGFTVTGVDSSSVALEKAERLAKKNHVTIETVHADLARYTIEQDSWDSIVSIFCHLPPSLRKTIHRRVVLGLQSGGTFLLEAYTPRQLEFGTGGPPKAEFMMDLGSLKEELAGLEFVHAQELIRDVSEGIKHTGQASVVQVLSRKP